MIRQSVPSPISYATILLFACLSLNASGAWASPLTASSAGFVVDILTPASTLARAGLQSGDIIRHWEPLISPPWGQRQPLTAFDWFWFTNELLPRGPVKVTLSRGEQFIDTIIFQGIIGAKVRPVLQEADLLLYKRASYLIANQSASEAARLVEEIAERQRKGSNLLTWWAFLTGTAYERSGNLLKAIEWHTKAITSTHDPLTQTYIWQSIGLAYQGAHQPRDAECAYQRALAISHAAWPGSLIDTTSLKALYLLAWESRDMESVRTYSDREDQILASQAPNSLQQADSWTMLGTLASRAGDSDRARIYHQKALALRRAVEPESRDTVRSLINLGNLELTSENHANARALYLEAMGILQRVAPESPEMPSLYANLGRVESATGRLVEAETMYRKALEHRGDDEVGRVTVLRSLSYLAQKRGDFIQAEDWSGQAVEALEKLAPHSAELADTLTSLGSIRFQMGDLDRAKDLFEAALAINQKLGKDELDLASGMNNIGSVLKRAGDFAGAEASWKRSLEILQRRMPDSPSTARLLHNMGDLKRSQDNPEAALSFFQRSLAIQRRLVPGSPELVETFWKLGSTLRDMGRYEEALAHQAESVAISKRVPLAESVQAEALYEESNTMMLMGRPQQALDALGAAVDLLEVQAAKIVETDENRTQFRSRFAFVYRDYIHALVDYGHERASFRVQELFLARSLTSLLAERELFFRDAPPELEASRVSLAGEYDLVQQKLIKAQSARDEKQTAELAKKLREIRDRQNNVIAMLRQSSPHLASLRHPEPLSVGDAQRTLDPGTLALSFNINKEASLLFALTSDGIFRVHRSRIGSDDLRHEISQFLGLLRERPAAFRRDTLIAQGKNLYKQLLGPVDDLIGRSKRIVLILDAPLQALPFAALVRESAGPTQGEGWMFLGESRALHISSSLTSGDLQRRLQEESVGEELVAFGDPIYPAGREGRPSPGDPYVRAASDVLSLGPLPWSRLEVERIAELFSDRSKVLLGDAATEETAKAILGRGYHRYVHFAGHGYLDRRFPLNSAVVLTMPKSFKSGDENGLLQAWEILEQLRLPADLVVLSACESGLGKEMGGEGLIGLTRAFQYAGARSVMASLWKISDRTTAEFMVRFYRHLKEGLSKDEALRATQIEFIRGPIQITNDKGERVDFDASAPYYWAAFQIYGDWQ